MPKIVILDGLVANPGDLTWDTIAHLGDLKVYDRTKPTQIYQRGKAAEIVIINKTNLDWYAISRLRKLKCICTLSTGYNTVDIDAANHFGITICNAVGYGSLSVAQHVFSLLLELTNQVGIHNHSVQQNEWANSEDWSYWKSPILELAGKTMGVYGYGQIGKKVAEIALAFGMHVIAVRQSNVPPENKQVKLVTFKKLLTESDVISLNAPLTDNNKGIINRRALASMKQTAYLINTGRGGLVNELDLKEALLKKEIAGAGLDVLSQEPPPENHLLLGIPNCLITPHQAWASIAARQRLIEIVANNIRAFLIGKPQNVVN